MASYSQMDLELTQDLENYNNAKEAIVDALVREGYINEDQGGEIKTKYAVVLVKNNWLGLTIGKLLGKKDVQYIKLVKIV
jgi:ribosomal protein L1